MISLMLDTKLSEKDMLKMATFLCKTRRLVEAAKQFTLDAVVDETSGTLPLMDKLRSAIADIEA